MPSTQRPLGLPLYHLPQLKVYFSSLYLVAYQPPLETASLFQHLVLVRALQHQLLKLQGCPDDKNGQLQPHP